MTLHEMTLHEAEAILKATFANIEERTAFSEEEKMAFTCAEDALCQAAREARRKINANPGEAIAFLYRNIDTGGEFRNHPRQPSARPRSGSIAFLLLECWSTTRPSGPN
jgi:hypothetical protein